MSYQFNFFENLSLLFLKLHGRDRVRYLGPEHVHQAVQLLQRISDQSIV